MSHNPYFTQIMNHVNETGDKNELRLMCETFNTSTCPCVGTASSSSGNTIRLVSTHPGYPGILGTPCVREISGDQPSTNEEYQSCLLASVCKNFFPDMSEKFDRLCTNTEECDIPTYVGTGSKSTTSVQSSW